MKKFVAVILIIAALLGFGIYNKEQLNIWFGMNDHQQAAHQFWFTQKNTLDETGETSLPLKKSVLTFGYVVNKPIEQDGKYYFETILFLNNQYPLPLFTVVKPVNGIWTVDQDATFASAGDASIQYYLSMYKNTIRNTHKYLEQDIPRMTDQELNLFVDKQLQNIKTILVDTYSTPNN